MGPRWTTNFEEHRQWCLTAPDATAQGEERARQDFLQTCRACQDYAAHAVGAARTNVTYNCGGQPPRFSLDAADHIRFCQSAQIYERRREEDARSVFLRQCLKDYNQAHNTPETTPAATPQSRCRSGMVPISGGGCDCPPHTYFDGRQCVGDGTSDATNPPSQAAPTPPVETPPSPTGPGTGGISKVMPSGDTNASPPAAATPQLVISKKAMAASCTDAGGGCLFDIVVSNTGTAPVTGPVEVVETVKADGALAASSNLRAGPPTPWKCAKTDQAQFICTHPGPVPSGGSVTLSVNFGMRAGTGAKAIQNCAQIKGGDGPSCASIPLIEQASPATPSPKQPSPTRKRKGRPCPQGQSWNGHICATTQGTGGTSPSQPQVCPPGTSGIYPDCNPGSGGAAKSKSGEQSPCEPGQQRDPKSGVCFSCRTMITSRMANAYLAAQASTSKVTIVCRTLPHSRRRSSRLTS